MLEYLILLILFVFVIGISIVVFIMCMIRFFVFEVMCSDYVLIVYVKGLLMI